MVKDKSRFFIIIIAIILIDQITKFFVSHFLNKPLKIFSFFSIDIIKNFGAGFGILQGQRILLIIISLLVVILIIYYFLKDTFKNQYLQIGFALIVGGAIGNLLDRIFYGFVVDFIYFTFWPAFNIADSAISIGAIIVIYYYIFLEK